MVTPVALYPAPFTKVITGGTPIISMFGPLQGGIIVNPYNPVDQGIAVVEPLYVDIVNPAATQETSTTVPIQPGGYYELPAGMTSNVSVNAATSGHKFSAFLWQTPTPYPPVPPVGPFPPSGPTTLTRVIPSYLYQEYSDDDDLQAFVGSYNTISQSIIDWFNNLNLPIYTSASIVGGLLDWVGTGIYGIPRPVLSVGNKHTIGPLNTWQLNVLEPNQSKVVGPTSYAPATDDIYKRVITWNFYKGDGNEFDIRWLKRRVMRFLIGTNGSAPNVDNTYQISVSFGPGGVVAINLIVGTRTLTGGAIPNRFRLNVKKFNEVDSTYAAVTSLPTAVIFKEAVAANVLQLPFQFTFIVNIQGTPA